MTAFSARLATLLCSSFHSSRRHLPLCFAAHSSNLIPRSSFISLSLSRSQTPVKICVIDTLLTRPTLQNTVWMNELTFLSWDDGKYFHNQWNWLSGSFISSLHYVYPSLSESLWLWLLPADKSRFLNGIKKRREKKRKCRIFWAEGDWVEVINSL